MSNVRSVLGVLALSAASLSLAVPGEAMPFAHVDAVAAAPQVDTASYVYHGRRFCFYPNGFRGPGYYLCGHRFRRGLFFAPGFFGGRGFRGGRGRRLGERAGHARPGRGSLGLHDRGLGDHRGLDRGLDRRAGGANLGGAARGATARGMGAGHGVGAGGTGAGGMGGARMGAGAGGMIGGRGAGGIGAGGIGAGGIGAGGIGAGHGGGAAGGMGGGGHGGAGGGAR